MKPEPALPAAAPDTPPVRPRILLVDDERLVLATLSRGLERQGYEVIAVATPGEAVARIEIAPADLAILDVRLGDQDGMELARELAGIRPLPVIFLSAFDDRDYIERAVAGGGYAYLVKPVTSAQIAPVIETVLARGREFASMRQSEEQLRSALDRERQVSMAVGLLMERSRMGSREAFELLRSRARAERRRILDVAGDIIRSVEMLNDLSQPVAPDPARPSRGAVK